MQSEREAMQSGQEAGLPTPRQLNKADALADRLNSLIGDSRQLNKDAVEQVDFPTRYTQIYSLMNPILLLVFKDDLPCHPGEAFKMFGLLLLSLLLQWMFAFITSFRMIIWLSRSAEELKTRLQHLEDEISDLKKEARAEKPSLGIEPVSGSQTQSETGTETDRHSASHVIELSSLPKRATGRDVSERGQGGTQGVEGNDAEGQLITMVSPETKLEQLESRAKDFRLYGFRRFHVPSLILKAIRDILLALVLPIFVVHIWCNKKGNPRR